MNPFQVVKDFEAELCKYTGAPYCVTTTSCTMALLLAVAWHLREIKRSPMLGSNIRPRPVIEIPKHTYVGVPMSIIHAGGRPTFRDEDWHGAYQLKPLPVWDSARWLTKHLWHAAATKDVQATTGECIKVLVGGMVCVSFHWAKTIGIQQGGAILHDDPEADRWLRMARFDGREEGVHPKDQKHWIIGHHAYMSPETAAAGLVRLALLPENNAPLPWGPGTDSDYPDLSQIELFK